MLTLVICKNKKVTDAPETAQDLRPIANIWVDYLGVRESDALYKIGDYLLRYGNSHILPTGEIQQGFIPKKANAAPLDLWTLRIDVAANTDSITRIMQQLQKKQFRKDSITEMANDPTYAITTSAYNSAVSPEYLPNSILFKPSAKKFYLQSIYDKQNTAR